jgi:hypothetical protein
MAGKFTENIADEVRRQIHDDAIRMKYGVTGEIFWVIEDSDTDYNVMLQRYPKNVFTTLAEAYAACVTNRNDLIFLSANTTHDLSAGIAWTKNRVNVVGLDSGDRLQQQGAKVRLVTAATTAYVIKNTGVRNSFRNIKFIQAATAATGLNVLQDGSEGSLYENCSFVFEVDSNIDLTTAHEVLAGSDSATFLNCTFGNDTLLTTGNRSVFHIDQVTASQEFKSNILRGCTFIISSSETLATFVRLDAVGDVLFTNLFDRCNFVASVDSAGGVALAEAVQTGTGTVKGGLYFSHPAAFNVTDFSTATSGRNTNVQLVGVVTTAGTGGIGVAPTA